MAIVTYNLEPGQKPTPEQIKEVTEACKKPHVFDEDCPELSDELIEQYARKGYIHRVSEVSGICGNA